MIKSDSKKAAAAIPAGWLSSAMKEIRIAIKAAEIRASKIRKMVFMVSI